MALVTSSLVSRSAASRSTGTCQDRMASRTRRRASAGAAGPMASRTRHPRRTPRSERTWRSCRSAGRGGAIVVIWFLPNRLTQVLMQLALQDIGQLTDLGVRGRIPDFGPLEGAHHVIADTCTPDGGCRYPRSLRPPRESPQ